MSAARFTSFATYQDLVGYIKCLQAGKSSTYCYNKGDNGVGASGKVTAQNHTPMCALPPAEMRAKWKSTKAAMGKHIICHVNGQILRCEVADIGPPGVCDLNPAALKRLGLNESTELDFQGTWEWEG